MIDFEKLWILKKELVDFLGKNPELISYQHEIDLKLTGSENRLNTISKLLFDKLIELQKAINEITP